MDYYEKKLNELLDHTNVRIAGGYRRQVMALEEPFLLSDSPSEEPDLEPEVEWE